jgi:choline dehydrogenase-like flavoprotein
MELAIIGSGPVGIWTAALLVEKGYSVTLFEAGGPPLHPSELNLSNYFFKTPSAVPEESHSLGGGSNLWMGRIGEFRQTDFEEIKGVRKSDWPFKKDELQRHYKKVAKLLTSQGLDDEYLDRHIANLMAPNLPKELRIRSFRFIELNVFMVLIDKLKTRNNFKLRLHTLCREITENKDGQVELRIFSNGVQSVEFFEKVFVCAGAIQSTALILRSKSLLDFSSAHLIGKGLMEHFDGYVGRLIVKKDMQSFWENSGSLDHLRKSHLLSVDGGFGLAISDAITLDEGLLNLHLEIVPVQNRYSFENHIHSSSKYQRSIILKFYAHAGYLIERVIKTLILKSQLGYNALRGRKVYSLWIKAEEIATQDSQISLSAENEEVAVYDHQIGEQSFNSLRKTLSRLRQIFKDCGLGEIKYYRFVQRKKGKFYLRPNWHPMGSLRMSKDRQTGVVRESFLLGDSKSVYIIDSSIFPTGSNANPTFTALALASKLVDDHF